MSPSKNCSHLETCPMFKLFTHSGTVQIWKDNYCQGEFTNCARYQRSQKGQIVPQNLLPNGKQLALPKR